MMKNNNKNNSKNTPFSYPYNFVSLGDINEIKREKRVKGVHSGKIKCSLKNLTPIFIGNKTDEKEEKTLTLKVEGTEKYVIPASTLKGEIRNIIEVLTTSCIKNVEEERLDYRGSAGGRKNVFGIIKKFPTANDEGIILGVDKVKVKFYDTIPKRKEPLEITSEFKKEGFYEINVNEKYKNHISKDEKPKDPKADDPKAINNFAQFENIRRGGTIKAVLWVSSDIYNKKYQKILVPNGETYSFTMSEYEDLLYLIKQRKEAEEKNNKNFYIDELKVRDTIIFEANDKNEAKNLTFSEIPRLRYKMSPLNLVPEEFHPCTTENLCFACRMFGTIGDHSKNEKGEKKQEKTVAMASKIFITDALSIKEKNKNMEERINLNPLGEPHPSLASFYLEKGTYDNQTSRIRGRKFYWHHAEKIKAGKGYKGYLKTLEYQGTSEKIASTIWFLKPDQNFEFEVTFKDLTDEELGILIYSLELEQDLLHKLGKAKAFGLGSCEIKITDCLLESSEKYNSFIKSYEKIDKEEYLEIVRKKYKLNTTERKEIEELKTILRSTNNLDFKVSPFPIDFKRDKFGNIKGNEENSLNWFVNKKREPNFKLPHILDYNKK
ncbi:TIGR03986 family CRISPR-associated RAMP protein [Fusobacterium sp. CM22]|uniref:TIGR03986 family type III CRISPR-associated RAMP protein n=1 Tax=Fusobacterium sp. CM22 TaxID=936563 RepID=UPI00044E0FCC|nr:TIGR03986 family CRISPR-associated RAMP protein [Fusobacterium sp. CM22]EUB12547.1 CRISPR-associated protein [Fusobacterium sp. CM22]